MRTALSKTAIFLLLISDVGYADVLFTTPFAPFEIDASASAANTAKSFSAAARMGHFAWTGTTPPGEQPLINDCAMYTGASPWPGSCNPAGMVSALHANGSGFWVRDDYSEAEKLTAVNAQVLHLTGSLRSPNVVPLYGHADHWAINHKIWKNDLGAVVEFDFYDGGPPGERDGTRSGYLTGEQFADSMTWENVFYKVITSVPATDPFYNRYVSLWEPPPGVEFPVVSVDYRHSPSPLGGDTKVTPELVRDLALKSLQVAGFTRHQEEWPLFATSTPVLPFEVAGVYPDGSDWDYYLVPFLNRDHVVGLVLLEKKTLRFQMATVLKAPLPFQGYSYTQAREIAQSSLRSGESIGQGILTWDPISTGEHAYSPMVPYYEFEVYSDGQLIGSAIVQTDDGRVGKLATGQMSRRLW